MIQIVYGIVLRAEDTGDFDQKITVYSREYGKFKAKVTGVKKVASKLRSLAQPFAESRLQVYLHGTVRAGVNDPGKIIGGESLFFHPLLCSDLDRMVQANIFCETLDTLTKTFSPNPEEYELLSSTLKLLETTESPTLICLRSTLILLKFLGYSLRHHPLWKSLNSVDRALFLRLAAWPQAEDKFLVDEVASLSQITQSYLALFLSRPLKSELFLRKVAAAA